MGSVNETRAVSPPTQHRGAIENAKSCFFLRHKRLDFSGSVEVHFEAEVLAETPRGRHINGPEDGGFLQPLSLLPPAVAGTARVKKYNTELCMTYFPSLQIFMKLLHTSPRS